MTSLTKWTVLAALLAAAVPPAAFARGGADDGAAQKRGRGGDDDGPDDNGGDDNGGNDDNGGDDDGGDDSGGSGKGGGGSWNRARQALVRDAASPDADTYGRVEVRTRSGRQRFAVEAELLDAGTAVEVFVADASGSLVSAGTAAADFVGEAELELDTGDGAGLPAGAGTVGDLAGRRVEVRLASGALLLHGTVPSLSGGGNSGGGSKDRAKEVVRDDVSGAKVKIEIRADRKSGRERLKLEVEHVAAGAAVVVRIADASGALADAASGVANAAGEFERKWDTRKGASLPAGAASVQELQGRAYEVVVDGVAVVTGTVPAF